MTGDNTAALCFDYLLQELGAFDFDILVKGPSECSSVVNVTGYANDK